MITKITIDKNVIPPTRKDFLISKLPQQCLGCLFCKEHKFQYQYQEIGNMVDPRLKAQDIMS